MTTSRIIHIIRKLARKARVAAAERSRRIKPISDREWSRLTASVEGPPGVWRNPHNPQGPTIELLERADR